MRTLITALILATLTGCATHGTEQRAAVVAAHPDWSVQTKQDVLSGLIRVGMTQEQVLASWGTPCLTCYGTRRSSVGEWWEYNPFGTTRSGIGAGKHLFFGPDGKLRYWSGQ
jgi:outer membrane protein assembly factor BamE